MWGTDSSGGVESNTGPPQQSVTGGTVVMEQASERTGEAGWWAQLSRNMAMGSWDSAL